MRVEKEKDHSIITTRVNISPGAKRIKREGITPDPLARTGLRYEEALAFWSEHSQEAFEITAVIQIFLILPVLFYRL